MQLVSPRPGSIASARVQLERAQGAAANLSNDPSVDTHKNLSEGVKAAKSAAAELFLAQPTSEFQDLVAARKQVLEGAELLERASGLLLAWGGTNSPLPHVQKLAHEAFDVFEGVFEILDND